MSLLKILHLCSYYISNELYKFLILELSKKVELQTVYVPLKKSKFINKNTVNNENIELIYDKSFNSIHRLFYYRKIKLQYSKIINIKKDLSNYDLIHSHTLFSDGGTAFLLSRKYNLRYIVTIRNTDLNVFYKYGWFLRNFAHKVLINADKVIFISPSYKEKAMKLFPKEIASIVEKKSVVIPNGIHSDWLIDSQRIDRFIDPIKIIFVGALDKNKNLETVINVVKKMNAMGYRVNLDVVGKGPLEDEFKNKVKKYKLDEKVIFYNYLDRKEIINLMDKSTIFLLPSIHETFGISYIEALSRGVPVIYTQNEGIDGFFEDGTVGYSVEPKNEEAIISSILKIINDYENKTVTSREIAKEFSWRSVGNKFMEIYKQIVIGDLK